LGEVLISLGIIDHSTLTEIIREQIQEAIFDLFLWGEGDFEYQDYEVGFTKEDGDVSMMQLVLETARRVDERIAVKVTWINERLRSYGADRAVCMRPTTLDSMVQACYNI
jgi:RNase H-fold protein (predicted Holliday junction resolvase)